MYKHSNFLMFNKSEINVFKCKNTKYIKKIAFFKMQKFTKKNKNKIIPAPK